MTDLRKKLIWLLKKLQIGWVEMQHTYRPPFTSISDVTASRALSTIYQNTTGKIMFVVATSTCSITAAVAGNGAYMSLQIGSASPPTASMGVSGLGDFVNTTPVMQSNFQCAFMVPPNYYYRVNKNEGNGTVVLSRWIEII